MWLTVADLSDSFFQMLLKAECQALTAFYSEAHGKRYSFTRCPQGLKNSPLHLKLLLDKLLGDMAQDVIHYADNIMIATNGSFEEHGKSWPSPRQTEDQSCQTNRRLPWSSMAKRKDFNPQSQTSRLH